MYESINIFSKDDLKTQITDNQIKKSIVIRGEFLERLEGVHTIMGTLGLSETTLDSFGVLKEV